MAMTSIVAPPPVIACARVIAYTHIDASIPFVQANRLFVGEKLLGRVPALAVCRNLAQDSDIILLHCDPAWNVLGATGADSIEGALASAERNYPGIDAHWVHLNTSVHDALAFYDEHFGGQCSFCGKRAFEVEKVIRSDSASICGHCVESFFRAMSSSPIPDA